MTAAGKSFFVRLISVLSSLHIFNPLVQSLQTFIVRYKLTYSILEYLISLFKDSKLKFVPKYELINSMVLNENE